MMGKPDIDEGDPRQDHGNHEKRRGDQFGSPGARGGRLLFSFLVMPFNFDGTVLLIVVCAILDLYAQVRLDRKLC